MRNRYRKRLSRFVDFCLCVCFFPSGIALVSFLYPEALHAIAEKFFLYIVSRRLSAIGDILEVGSYRGASALALAAGNRASSQKAKVWCIEPSPQPSKEVFLNLFRSHGVNQDIILIDKTSEEAEKEIAAKFKFVFIDGNHDYVYVTKDIRIWKERLVDGGIIALHNISLGDVAKAVNEQIEQSPDFTVHGVIAETFYASKRECKDAGLITRFKKLQAVRQKCINLGR
jgi:predicted O-methyltransferase YrrM